MSKERRRHVRKRVSLDATIVLGDGQTSTAVVRDMSLGGALLELGQAPPFGTTFQVTFVLEGEPIEAKATVRWSKRGGVGVQFGLFGARQTYLITEHLATAEPTPDTRQPPDTGKPADSGQPAASGPPPEE